MDSLIGLADMKSIGIGIRIDSNRFDAHLFCCTNDATSDFATIGNQDFFNHLKPQSGIVSCLRSRFSTFLLRRAANARATLLRVE